MLVEGQVYDDLLCVKYEGKNSHYQNLYTMQCTVCGRTKVCKDYVVLRHTGTLHKACGKGLKTEDSKFYSIWQSMRTRTTNHNYWAAEHYSEKGINSDEFEYFIDFYDKMYESYCEAKKLYGDNVSLERKDNSLSYSSDNCVWIPLNEQQGNTTRNRRFKAISPSGEIFIDKNVSKFCREHNLIRAYVVAALGNYKDRTQYTDWKFEYLDK